jgi:hypothetical protein
MKNIVKYSKRFFAAASCGFFAILWIDWLLGLIASCIDSPFRGAFFNEVWGITQNLFTWIPGPSLTRLVAWFVVGCLTFSLPALLSYLSFRWFDRLLSKK